MRNAGRAACAGCIQLHTVTLHRSTGGGSGRGQLHVVRQISVTPRATAQCPSSSTHTSKMARQSPSRQCIHIHTRRTAQVAQAINNAPGCVGADIRQMSSEAETAGKLCMPRCSAHWYHHHMPTPQGRPNSFLWHDRALTLTHVWAFSVVQYLPHCSNSLVKVVDARVKAEPLNIKLAAQPYTHVRASCINGNERCIG